MAREPGPARKVEVTDNALGRRYEMRADGVLVGGVDYRVREGRRVFTHVVIDEEYRGRGLSLILVQAALDDVRARA